VTYPVLDLFFTARAADTAAVRDPEEVAAAGWFAPEAVREDDLAFPSMRAAWRVFRASARTPVAP
jgi:hypothetical protein